MRRRHIKIYSVDGHSEILKLVQISGTPTVTEVEWVGRCRGWRGLGMETLGYGQTIPLEEIVKPDRRRGSGRRLWGRSSVRPLASGRLVHSRNKWGRERMAWVSKERGFLQEWRVVWTSWGQEYLPTPPPGLEDLEWKRKKQNSHQSAEAANR